MPENSYVSLETRARVFVEVVTPIKAAFIERMMPEDFDQTLQRLIDDFVRARERKHAGRTEQVGGTAGLSAAIRRGMQLAREIDAIMKAAYANDPSQLAAWKSAVRVQRAPETSLSGTTSLEAERSEDTQAIERKNVAGAGDSMLAKLGEGRCEDPDMDPVVSVAADRVQPHWRPIARAFLTGNDGWPVTFESGFLCSLVEPIHSLPSGPAAIHEYSDSFNLPSLR